MCPFGAGEFVTRFAEDIDEIAVVGPTHRRATRNVVDHTEDTDHRRRKNRDVAGLVVERHIATGYRCSEFEAAIGKSAYGFRELPHDFRILGRAEIQAVRDREWHCAGNGNVAVRLRECELCAGIRIKLRNTTIAVRRQCNTETGLFIDAHHARVLGLREHGVAKHIAVVLTRDPGLRRKIRCRRHTQHRVAEFCRCARAGECGRCIGLQRVLPSRTVVGAFIHRAVVGNGARRYIDDCFAMPCNDESTGVRHFTDVGCDHIPLLADRHELFDVCRRNDGAHAFLGFRHQDFFGAQRWITERHPIKPYVHAAFAVACELRRRARDAGATKILDAFDKTRMQQLERALDE